MTFFCIWKQLSGVGQCMTGDVGLRMVCYLKKSCVLVGYLSNGQPDHEQLKLLNIVIYYAYDVPESKLQVWPVQ